MLHAGAPGEIYNIGAGNETPEPGARRQAPRPARQGRVARSTTSTTASGTTAATRSTSPRSPPSGGRSSARSTRRSRRPSTGTAPTSGGGGPSSRPADARPDHRRGGPARHRPRAHLHRGGRRGRSPATAAELDLGDRDSVLPGHPRRRAPTSCSTPARGRRSTCASPIPSGRSTSTRSAREWVADACRRAGAHLVAVSTDYVFDGTKPEPYHEWDRPNPQSVYGRSKWAGEHAVAVARARVVRRAHGVGVRRPRPQHGEDRARPPRPSRAGLRRRPARAARASPPTWRRPSGSSPRRAVPGVFHVTNQGATTWYGFVRDILEAAGATPARSGRSPPRSSIRPGPRRGRPTRCWTTPPCAWGASRCCPTTVNPSIAWCGSSRAAERTDNP